MSAAKARPKLMSVNAKGQVTCVLCSVEVKSEAVWTAHVNGRLHRDKAAQLRQKAAGPKRPQPLLSASTIPAKKPRTDALPKDFFDHADPKEEKRVCLAAQEASKAVKRAAKDATKDPTKEPAKGMTKSPGKAEEEAKAQTSKAAEEAGADGEEKQTTLPAGFFDDKARDAAAQGKEEPAAEAEAEWERWQKELRAATAESAAIAADADEADIASRELDQAEDQLARWQRVRDLQERKEDVVKAAMEKAAREAAEGRRREAQRDAMDVDDDDAEEDLHDLLDWRAKNI